MGANSKSETRLESPKGGNDQNETQQIELFRTFLLEHLVIVSSFGFRIFRRLYLRFPDVMTLLAAAFPGICVLRSASMKMNWFGGAAQTN